MITGETEPMCESSTYQKKDMSFCFATEVGGRIVNIIKNSTGCKQNIPARAKDVTKGRKINNSEHKIFLANFNLVLTTTQGLF